MSEEVKTSKISVTRALTKLKILDSKLDEQLRNPGNYMTVKMQNKSIPGFKNIDEFKDNAKADYQKIVDNIKVREVIKRELLKSNATVDVTINGVTMKVVEAIELKQSIVHKENLLKSFKALYRNVMRKFVDIEEEINSSRKIEEDNYRKNLTENTDKTPGDIESTLTAFRTTFDGINKVELIDPIDLKTKIEELEKEINGFLEEVDYVLSESNASTMINIPD